MMNTCVRGPRADVSDESSDSSQWGETAVYILHVIYVMFYTCWNQEI